MVPVHLSHDECPFFKELQIVNTLLWSVLVVGRSTESIFWHSAGAAGAVPVQLHFVDHNVALHIGL